MRHLHTSWSTDKRQNLNRWNGSGRRFIFENFSILFRQIGRAYGVKEWRIYWDVPWCINVMIHSVQHLVISRDCQWAIVPLRCTSHEVCREFVVVQREGGRSCNLDISKGCSLPMLDRIRAFPAGSRNAELIITLFRRPRKLQQSSRFHFFRSHGYDTRQTLKCNGNHLTPATGLINEVDSIAIEFSGVSQFRFVQ